jgi:hypothetical protein
MLEFGMQVHLHGLPLDVAQCILRVEVVQILDVEQFVDFSRGGCPSLDGLSS